MKISKKMQDAINVQMKNEYDNAFLYLSIASWFEQKSLKGFAHWNFVQYQEEQEHALKFYNYLLERQGEAIVDAVAKPQKDWNSVIDVFKDILAKEKETTENIYKLYEIALEEKDYTTQGFLKWYLDEQVEEEDNASTILEKLEMIGDSKSALVLLDKELGERKAD